MAAVVDSSQKSECRIHTDGTKEWFLNGKRHREGINPETGLTMPAIEYSNGDKYWYLNGELHREGGPAIECANGDKWWYLNGELHRKDGPAIEYANGKTRYWINDNYIPQLDNKRIYGKENLQKFLLLI